MPQHEYMICCSCTRHISKLFGFKFVSCVSGNVVFGGAVVLIDVCFSYCVCIYNKQPVDNRRKQTCLGGTIIGKSHFSSNTAGSKLLRLKNWRGEPFNYNFSQQITRDNLATKIYSRHFTLYNLPTTICPRHFSPYLRQFTHDPRPASIGSLCLHTRLGVIVNLARVYDYVTVNSLVCKHTVVC